MTFARCADCGRDSTGNPAVIIHAPGCSVGRSRQQASAMRNLERAAEERDRAERRLAQLRDRVRERARYADELDVPRTAIAEAAKLTRRRLYTVLDGK